MSEHKEYIMDTGSLFAKVPLASVSSRIEEGVNFLKAKSSGLQFLCDCLSPFFEFASDIINNPSPEDKQKRRFNAKILPVLMEGAYFTLIDYKKQDDNAVSRFSKSMMGTLGLTSSTGSGESGNGHGNAVGLLKLSKEKLQLDWSTLELVRNEPKMSCIVKLADIKTITTSKNNNQLLLSDDKEQLLLLIESSDSKIVLEWMRMLKESLTVFSDLIEEGNSQEKGLLWRQQRLMELEMRKREREKQKLELNKKLGAKGYLKK